MDVFDLSAKITLDDSEYLNGLNNASSKTDSFGSTMSGVFSAIAKAITVASTAMAGFAGASVKVGAEFDSAMSEVEATMSDKAHEIIEINGEQIESIKLLTDYAKEMGTKTEFSATQSANALNYMALAGYDAETSIGMLPNVLNLASAGSMELARASDMITDAQTALGLNIEQTTMMVDEMAKTASSSNTSVSQLGEAFLTVGGLAQYMGTATVEMSDGTTQALSSTQELSTVLGILANNGIKGSEAGTHLRNMILKLSEPTDDGAEMMKKLGLSVYDAEGNMRSFQDIFGDLNVAMANFTDEEKIDAFAQLFNTRDIAGATALLNATVKDWNDLGSAIADAGGEAEKMANTKLDNLSGDVTKFKSAFEGAQILVSEQLTPSLRKFVQFGTDGLSELSNAFKEGGVSGAMSKLGDLLSEGLKMIIDKVPQFIGAGMELLGSLGKGLIDNAPLLVDTAFQLFDMFIDSFTSIDMGDTGSKLLALVEQIATGIVERLPVLIDVGFTILETLVNGIVESIPTLLPQALDFIQQLADKCAERAPELIQRGFELLQKLVEGIVEAIPILVEKVPTIITTFANIINDNMPTILKMGLELIVQLVKGIISAIPVIIQNVPKIVEAIIAVIEAVQWLDLGKNIIEGLAKGIKSMVSHAGSAIKTVNEGIINLLKQMPAKIKTIGTSIIKDGLIGGIKKMINNLLSTIGNLMLVAVQKFGSFSLKDVGKNLIKGLWEGISNMAQWIYDKIAGFGAGVVNAVKDIFGVKSPSKVFKQIGSYCAEGLAIGMEDMADMTQTEKAINNSLDKMNLHQLNLGEIQSQEIKINTSYQTSSQDIIDTAIDRVVSVLEKYLPSISNMQMVLDTGALVGEIAPSIDYELGNLIKLKAR